MKTIYMVFEDNDFEDKFKIAKSLNLIDAGSKFEGMDKGTFLKFVATLRKEDKFDVVVTKG